MTLRWTLLPVLTSLLVLVASGQEFRTSDRFQLFNDCKAMSLEVGEVLDDVLALGIADENVQAAVESRLRAENLYTSSAPETLYVAVSRYAVQLKYRKLVRDIASNEIEPVWTFVKAAEVRDGTAASIILELSMLLDEFLVQYLRVNESACGQIGEGEDASRIENAKPFEPSPPRSDTPVPRVDPIVTQPTLLQKVEPDYSEWARQARIEGTVLLSAEIWEDGRAYNFKVLESLGYGLDQQAIKAVEQWKFAPGKKEGKPVKVLAQFQVSFRLLESPR